MSDQPNELVRVVVQRSKWLRGKGVGMLRDACGLQCCLGFVAVAAGFAEADIEEVQLVSELLDGSDDPRQVVEHALLRPLVEIEADSDEADGFLAIGTDLEDQLVRVNDDDDEAMSDARREAELIEIAAAGGIEFVFVD
jgi:hypothetical protein